MQVSAEAGTAGRVDEVLKVVADPVRLRILGLLGAEQLCVCHLQEALGASQTLVSHHLRVLRLAGLVDAEPFGPFVYYRLRPGGLEAVRATVSALADAGTIAPARRPC